MPPLPFRAAPLLAPLVLLLAACGDGGTDAPVPATLTLEPAQVALEGIGATAQLTAQVRDEEGDPIAGADVAWTSDREGVARVDDTGLVTATGLGTATITARAGVATATASVTVDPPAAFACAPGTGQPVNLAVGELLLVTDPGTFCLTFPGGAGLEFLLGVQSVSPNGRRMDSVRVQSRSAPAAGPLRGGVARPSPSFPRPSASGPRLALDSDARALDARRAREHARRMERDARLLAGPIAAGRPAAAPAVVGTNLQVGDTLTLRVRNAEDIQCAGFTEVQAELVWKGDRAWWFDDAANPDALTLTDWQRLADEFDDITHPAVASYLGEPADLDRNGVIAVLFTKELNLRGDEDGITTLGFVNPCDLFDRVELAASNEGEFFYHIAADPAGVHGDTIATGTLVATASSIIGHEYAHIIQFSRRYAGEFASFMEVFVAEGQATLMEEVLGHRRFGNSPGQNYGADVVLGESERAWYLNPFIDLFSYYGVDFETGRVVEEAPERCTWVSETPADPCKGRALWYGVTWSLLRWVSDQYGPGFPGGERELHQRLVDHDLAGLDLIEDVVGEDASWLLGHWAPMLYLDDRPLPRLDPLLSMTSWNLNDIYTVRLRDHPLLLLGPHLRERSTPDWEDDFAVRSPSFEWYLLVNSATGGPAATVRVSTEDLGVLPSHMQLFVVRTN